MPKPNLDPAALLGAAMSLYLEGHKQANAEGNNLSDTYSGGDEFMRQCMRVAEVFETWAGDHVDFDGTVDCWPYLLEGKFGRAVIELAWLFTLDTFKPEHCQAVAKRLGLPLMAIPAPKPHPNFNTYGADLHAVDRAIESCEWRRPCAPYHKRDIRGTEYGWWEAVVKDSDNIAVSYHHANEDNRGWDFTFSFRGEHAAREFSNWSKHTT